jgi:transposase-like protein
MARPNKISEELISAICEDIARGYSYDQAAQRNGIAASTFFRWMQLSKDPSSETIYSDFAKRVCEASEFSADEALQLIRSAAVINRNWKAAAWSLEHRFPEQFSGRVSRNTDDLKNIENKKVGNNHE